MQPSAPNHDLFPSRPSPTIPGEWPSRARVHPPEELFGLRPTEHVALPPQRNNLRIAVAAFVVMLLLGLLAAFFRLRLQLERNDGMDVRSHAPASPMDSVARH
jgi:hypothetical protein